ncbi:hypothetical protein BGW80DRAFT_831527 [Lactifluus volemus]|nr:hypothetical protein BGW80DRAFT_831527 [Lactifluus volemus]
MFTQSDMHPSNFGVDQNGKTVLMDFAEIGLLPETFVAHTMFSEKRLVPIAIALGLSDSSIVPMTAVSSLLWMVANPTLDLDEHGNPETSGMDVGGASRATRVVGSRQEPLLNHYVSRLTTCSPALSSPHLFPIPHSMLPPRK